MMSGDSTTVAINTEYPNVVRALPLDRQSKNMTVACELEFGTKLVNRSTAQGSELSRAWHRDNNVPATNI